MEFNEVLNEICKVSAIKATGALAKFLHAPVGIELKPVEVKHIDEITLLMKDDENIVILSLPITNNLQGSCYFIYSHQAALSLCDELFSHPDGTTKSFDVAEISALAEISNIVIGVFLTSLANSLQMDKIMHRSATFEMGEFRVLFDKKLAALEEKIEEVVVKICFGFQHVNIQGYVLIIFEEGELNKVFKKCISTDSDI
jgi:chemotaxis protein CheY-P-specific phosphatase CheC